MDDLLMDALQQLATRRNREDYYMLTVTEPRDGRYGKIEFTTTSEEMFQAVRNYTENVIDATKWRRMPHEVKGGKRY